MAEWFGTLEPTNSSEAGTTVNVCISSDGTIVVPKKLLAGTGLTEEQQAVAWCGRREKNFVIATENLLAME